MTELRFCILVPHYNHAAQFAAFLPALAEVAVDVLVVDDGSSTEQLAMLDAALTALPTARLLRCPVNAGKGAAVIAGASELLRQGYTHFVQIDADGQHDLSSLAEMLDAAERHPDALISGLPEFSADIPPARLHGRKISLWWARIETLSMQIQDAMCGYRVYPLQRFVDICRAARVSSGMPFDTDIMVRYYWAGSDIRFVPVAVSYPHDGRSHFRVLRDNILISAMHTRLFFGMLWRCPRLLGRNWRKKTDGARGETKSKTPNKNSVSGL